jgi:hypothetical protein
LSQRFFNNKQAPRLEWKVLEIDRHKDFSGIKRYEKFYEDGYTGARPKIQHKLNNMFGARAHWSLRPGTL